jgi:hypothetical protein
MGFSGSRALILIAVFVVLFAGIKYLHFPTWSAAAGIVVAGMLLRGAESRSDGK